MDRIGSRPNGMPRRHRSTRRWPYDPAGQRVEERICEQLAERGVTGFAAGRASPASASPASAETRERQAEELECVYVEHAARRASFALQARRVSISCGAPYFGEIADKLLRCRRKGVLCCDATSGRMMSRWLEKCGLTRWCPQEAAARADQLSLDHVPTIVELVTADRNRRLMSGVFKLGLCDPGRLEAARQSLWEQFAQWRERTPGVVAAFAAFEATWQREEQWLAHLHCLLVLEGSCDWDGAVAAWPGELDWETMDRPCSVDALCRFFRYVMSPTPYKSALKHARGESTAPPFSAWPDARVLEWDSVHVGHRRTRAYGELYNVAGKRWRSADTTGKRNYAEMAELPEAVAEASWSSFSKATKWRLKHRILRGAVEPRAQVVRVADLIVDVQARLVWFFKRGHKSSTAGYPAGLRRRSKVQIGRDPPR
jgi:hypothetical protein